MATKISLTTTLTFVVLLTLTLHTRDITGVCDLTKGCYPQIFDALANVSSFPSRSLVVSSVCGRNATEQYMSLLTSDFTIYTCDPTKVTAANMLDGNSATYWQSSVGSNPQFVEIRLTDKFLLFELLVTFSVPNLPSGRSADARPLAWSVEKLADDNSTWVPLRHFAKNCATSFPGAPVYDPFSQTNIYNVVYCEQYRALENGNTFLNSDNLTIKNVSQVTYTPGYFDIHSPFSLRNNPIVSNYFTTSGVRLSFASSNRVLAQQNYISIGNLLVDVRCQCNGHAEKCSGPNGATCECQHFTSGQYCDSCLPLYNNQSWTIGTTTNAGACEKCSCNNHASSCVFNQANNYGICQDCQNNTAGSFCETCATGFYVNPGWTSTSSEPFCLPCACNEAGTMTNQLNVCDGQTGQCNCKANVQGRDCSECKDTYYNLTSDNVAGCVACSCNSAGTLGQESMCNKTTGACLCRTNVEGVSCNSCKVNTYGFNTHPTDGCLACGCDPGGAVGQSCDLTTGQCSCRANINGRTCMTPNSGTFVPRLDLIVLEPELTVDTGIVLRAGQDEMGATSTGRGLVTVTPASPLQMNFTAGFGGLMNMATRYEKTTSNNLIFLKATLSLTSAQGYSCGSVLVNPGQTWSLSKTTTTTGNSGALDFGQVCLGQGSSYSLMIDNSGSSLLIDSVVFVPDKTVLTTGVPGLVMEQVDSCVQDAMVKVRRNRDACKQVEFSLMAAFLNGAQTCSCTGGSLANSLCDPFSGDCNCRPGALPPQCETCQSDFYQFSLATGCTACACHVNGSVNPFCNATGVCQCRSNVQGNKCDSCIADHFGLHTGQGCSPCQCNPTYSQGSSCDDYGQCICKFGVGGTRCDRCAGGHYNLTSNGCTTCACDVDGSTGVGCDKDTGVCQCRDNVEGKECDTCKPGFFGLGKYHPGGCIPCFCWDKGANCTTSNNVTASRVLSPMSVWPDGWTAVNSSGDSFTVAIDGAGATAVLKLSQTSFPDQDLLFLAPEKYLADQSSSYGRNLLMSVTPYQLPTGADPAMTNSTIKVILKGAYAAKALIYTLVVQLKSGKQSYQIPMSETNWKAVDKSSLGSNMTVPSQTATFDQMMMVLTAMSALKIQAYNPTTPGFALSLNSVELETGSGSDITNVEMCQCQNGYGGKHCEICASGFTRTSPGNPDPNSQCAACNCNGHTQQNCNHDTGVCQAVPCDPLTGVCVCMHNTEGNNCQNCQIGYYGDPTKGTPDDCLPCACPGVVVNKEVNVFATSCSSNSKGAPVCNNCTQGHSGDHCEICVDGYYGTPENATNNGGKCVPCVCNGRADTCNPRTGMCSDCRNNTAGQQCEICAPGYYGNAMTFSCQECVCKNYTGSTGQCDPSTGICECLPNVEGNLCDQCKAESYDLQPKIGCKDCNCHQNGSTSTICDKVTGKCPCRNLVLGRQCDSCQDSFWNINTARGCDACACNQQGTAKNGSVIIPTCDLITGQCQCALPGTSGRTCDSCSPVTTFRLTYIQLFYLGQFPDCRLCGECFDSWGVTIDNLGKETQALDDQTQAIWEQFDKQTPEQIASRLSVTEEKIQMAAESVGTFQEIAQNLVTLQERINQATQDTNTLTSRSRSYSSREQALRNQLSVLESLTEIIRLTASTTVTVTALNQEVNTITQNIQTALHLGTSSWEEVQRLSFVVADPVEREKRLIQQAQASMQIANLANQTFQLAEILYENNLKPSSDDAAKELAAAQQQRTEASNILTSVQTTANQVTANIASIRTALASLVGASSASRARTLKMVDDLELYVANASSAQRDVESGQRMADAFLLEAQMAEKTMRDSMSTILDNLAALTKAQSDLLASQTQSTAVLSVTLRPLTQLQAIMTDIMSVPVSRTDVNALELKAQKALVLAEESLTVTRRALGLARDVNQEVNIMEEDIATTRNLRTQAMGLKNAADMINSEIRSTLTQAENHINMTVADIASVSTMAQEVLANVTTVTTCLDQGAIKARDATTSATRAEERAQTTSQNQQVLIDLMLAINQESGDQTVSQALNSLTQASSTLDQVVQGRQTVQAVTNIETLVQDLVSQVQELNTLDGEINALTAELDSLVLSLEENLDTGSCST